MKHLNRQISIYGRECVSQRFPFKETNDDRISPTGYEIEKNGIRFPCKVFTKVHDIRQEMRVTGRDYSDVMKLEYLQRKWDRRILLLFVDVMLGECYGDFLDTLMCTQGFCESSFPMQVPTKSGKIIYWSVDLMPTLFKLNENEKNHLALLTSDNKVDKNQIRLI